MNTLEGIKKLKLEVRSWFVLTLIPRLEEEHSFLPFERSLCVPERRKSQKEMQRLMKEPEESEEGA